MRTLIFVFFLMWVVPVLAVPDGAFLRQVEKAPKVDSKADIKKLVQALTTSIEKDEDKAYVLLLWIVKNIDYDDYRYRQSEDKASSNHSRAVVPEAGDILKKRLGMCGDISDLYKDMLREAKIKAYTIEGCTNEVDKKQKKCQNNKGGHAWNVVWIENQWEFVDPTWAITGEQKTAMENVSRKSEYNREMKKRERKTSQNYKIREGRVLDEKWFMTDPRTMQENHKPYDKKWLLLDSKDRKNKKL